MDGFSDYDWAGLIEKIAFAIVILLVTWILAKVVRWAFAKLVGKIGVLQRSGSDGKTLGDSLGQIAALVIWLFGLVAVLQVFALERVLEPITELLTGLLEFLPNIIGAAFVFIVGALIAKILRQLIETALGAVNFEGMIDKGRSRANSTIGTGGDPATTETGTHQAAPSQGGNMSATIARTVATVVYALVMIVVIIAAVQILGISSISDPAEQMLTTIFDSIPRIIAALLLLGLGIMIARFAGDLLEQILAGFGTDRAFSELGVETGERTASSVIAKIAQVAIVLFFAVMAAQLLEFPQITAFLSEVLELGGKVLFGAAIIAAGFFVANLISRMMGEGLASDVIRYATIVLFVAMGLRYMGVANSIIELAFGALVVGGALAAAIAFGLGGRDAAARTLSRFESSRGNRATSTTSATGTNPPGGSGPLGGPPPGSDPLG